jgi:hypothetical protein
MSIPVYKHDLNEKKSNILEKGLFDKIRKNSISSNGFDKSSNSFDEDSECSENEFLFKNGINKISLKEV